jgi:predicted dehydrogenase
VRNIPRQCFGVSLEKIVLERASVQDVVKTIAILGAGARGNLFADLIRRFGHLGKVVAVAEPRDDYRRSLAEQHQIPSDGVFATWQDFCKKPKLCDAVIISTLDREHAGPAIACLDKGYDVLLEKPMAATLSDCLAIEQAQRRSGRIMGVCHSMRYQKGFRKVKDLVASGAIGRLITIDLIEQVNFWHQAHSFVRGNFGNESRTTFMLMAKSCHDIDYLCYLVGQPCQRVSSFGALTYFRKENAPPDSTERCTDPCPAESRCEYSAIKQYVDGERLYWPAAMCSHDHSREAHFHAIQTGPYGRCVYKCDNDAVDHQVVNLQFAADITATFTMTAFTLDGGRKLRVHGTAGELFFDEKSITIKTFADRNVQHIDIGTEDGGHGGGDARVIQDWLLALHSRDASAVVANAQESLASHTVVFAAEKSRREKRMIELAEMEVNAR